MPSNEFSTCSCNVCVEERQAQAREAAAASPFDPSARLSAAESLSAQDEDLLAALTAPVPAPAAPIITSPDDRAAALTTQRLALMAERAIAVVPRRSSTEYPDHILWHGYKGNHTLWLTPDSWMYGTESVAAYASYYGSSDKLLAEKHVGHPTKPIYVRGWFVTQMPSSGRVRYVYFSPDVRNKVQRAFRHTLRADGTSVENLMTMARARLEVTTPRAKRITSASVPPVVRREFYRTMMSMMVDAGRVIRTEGVRRISAFDTLANPGWPSETATWRGSEMSPHEYKATRVLFKQVGAIVTRADAGDIGTLRYLLDNMPRSNNRPAVINNILRAWNHRCAPDDELILASCGHVELRDQLTETVDGQDVCTACINAHYAVPIDSHAYYRLTSLHTHSDGQLYTYRESSTESPLVRNYSDNVLRYYEKDNSITPSAYGEFLMGIELEMWPKKARRLLVQHTHDWLCNGYAIMKNDGSLPTGGFEVVTAPRGLVEHIQRFNAWTPHPDLRAWEGGKCGVHVHISSQAFSQATLGKFIEFINARGNDGLIKAIAGRTPDSDNNAAQYCQREGSMIAGNPKRTLAYKDSQRYRMVNTANLSEAECSRLGIDTDHANGKAINTVELRIFRASLNKKRLLAQLEFAHAAVMFCRATSMRELTTGHFMTWLRTAAGLYPHLARWMGVRAHKVAVERGNDVLIAEEV